MRLNKLQQDMIEQEVNLGFIDKQIENNLIHYTYTREATEKRHWNASTLMCRGLIVDQRDLRIVAYPFDKFFNYEEHEKQDIDFLIQNHTYSVTEKLDGVLAISYYDENGSQKFCTRCGMNTEKSKFASLFFKEKYGDILLPKDTTFCFEMISNQTYIQSVYDYSDMVVIGARNLDNGLEYKYDELNTLCKKLGLRLVKYLPYNVTQCLEVQKTLAANQEGFVLHFDNGAKVKIKGDQYVKIGRIMRGFSDKRIAELWASGQWDAISLSGLPEEFVGQIQKKIEDLDKRLKILHGQFAYCQLMLDVSSNIFDKKDVAIFCEKRYISKPIKTLIFAHYDGKDTDAIAKSMILKKYDKT